MRKAEPYRLAEDIPDHCPHCGQELTLWEQVLLSVDRMLVCRNCWYRIMMDSPKSPEEPPESNNKGQQS